MPEQFGGDGIDDPRFGIILVEECLERGLAGLGLIAAMHIGVGVPHLLRHATAEQQLRWLPDLAGGRRVAGVVDGAALGAELDIPRTVALSGGAGTAAADLFIVSGSVRRERRVFGRPLAELENTRTVLGAAAAQTCAVSDLAYTTAAKSVERGPHWARRAAAARLAAAAAHRCNADIGLQLHGGYGYMREYPIAQCYADAAVLTAVPVVGTRNEDELATGIGL